MSALRQTALAVGCWIAVYGFVFGVAAIALVWNLGLVVMGVCLLGPLVYFAYQGARR